MLNEHDQDMLLRCRRLGHEINFGYCRREQSGKPCRLVFNCWFESFDVEGFFKANLTPEEMGQLEQAAKSAPPPKVSSLMDIIQQAQQRVNASKPDSKP